MAEAVAALGVAANVVQFIDFGGKILSEGYRLHKSKRVSPSKNEELKNIALDLQKLCDELQPPKRVSPNKNEELENIAFDLQKLRDELQSPKRVSPSENEELKNIALDLQKLRDELQSQEDETAQMPTPNDIQLQRLAEQCRGVCLELLGALEALKVVDNPGKWESFCAALKTVWAESKIKSLQNRLDEARQELIVRILMSFREQLSGSMDKQIAIQESVNGINLSTQGLGEKFLGFIQDSAKWKADLIHAIHQERAPPSDRARSDHAHISARHGRLQRALIESLRFAEMTDRHHRIVEAYEKTFQWLFLPGNANQQKWTDFAGWLKGKSTLYWVTGKTGSGKSTLMKYIYGDKRTMDHLKTWAAGVPLVTAAFFFWNSGTRMQMSEVGFLQSILSQVLTERPALIPRILPERWEAYDLFGHDESVWSQPELQRAFRLLAREEAPEAKFCFFIDGLDEFDGDHTNLIRLIKDISPSSNIKLCVSSRPWVLFEDAFKHKPSLMLQDLTYPDIKHFIDSSFNNNPEFVELEKRESGYASELLRDIAQKSAGVFLWVNLVVRSLLAGLGNGDRVSDLQRRLDLLPLDLENLYEKILNSLDPFYLEHASQIFQHVRAANEPPSLLCLSFADEEPEYIFKMEVRPLPKGEEFYRADIMRRRLNSRCKGLLEVDPAVLLPIDAVDVGDVSPVEHSTSVNGCLAKGISLANLTVQYLHRTVKDFLETPQVWGRIMLACPRTYDPYMAMCRSSVAQLKCLDPRSTGKEAFEQTLRVLLYAHSIQDRLEEGQSTQSLVSLLDEFDRTATNLHKASGTEGSWPSKFLDDLLTPENEAITSRPTFLALAVWLGLHTYVEAKVHHGCLAHDKDGLLPLLSDAIKPRTGCCEHLLNRSQSVKMVKMLLKHGADPNEVCLTKQECMDTTPFFQRANTVWHQLLENSQSVSHDEAYVKLRFTHCCGRTQCFDKSQSYWPSGHEFCEYWTELVYWFLVYGADTTVDLGTHIRPLLMNLPKDQYDRVLAIMKGGRCRIWSRMKNPNFDSFGRFKTNHIWPCPRLGEKWFIDTYERIKGE